MAYGNFRPCLEETLKWEGGYVDHPKDPGGETNYGITKAVARENGYTGDMRKIPMSLVERIYKEKYWDAVKADTLKPGVDLATFDFGVNSGPARARQYLMKAIGSDDDTVTIKKLCAARLSFVQQLKTWATFGKGWSRRIAGIEAKSIQMCLAARGTDPTPVLTKEASGAGKQAKKDAALAAGTAVGGGATQVPDAPTQVPVDWTTFDWSTLAGVGFVAVIALTAVYLGWRTYVNYQRKKAYETLAAGGEYV